MVIEKIVHSRPYIDDDDLNAVIKVLKGEHMEDGSIVKDLESTFSKKYDRKYSFAVSNGYSSILLGLRALDISEGDEVLLPSYTCQALLYPILQIGAIPIVVDVEPDSFNISKESVQGKISDKTKAIIVPHTFGFPADVNGIKELGVPVIEDCAQSIGGWFRGKRLGTFGDISVSSFYATKMITGGDGGIIMTDNGRYADIIDQMRYYGHRRGHHGMAYNCHLTNLPAALVLSQLSKLEMFVQKRKQIATMYDYLLDDCPNLSIIFDNKDDSCYYRYLIRVPDANEMIQELKGKGIGCGYGVLEGMHQLLMLDASSFPNTERNLRTIVSIPIYPRLELEKVEYIAENIIKICKAKW